MKELEMNFETKIEQLRKIIRHELTSLINHDYRLLEIPDYPNVGDALIFQGELDFLRTVSYECKELSTMASFAERLPDIPKDDLLIFSGGGFFGDIWPAGSIFKRKVFGRYPDNPKLIFPQSVCFQNAQNLKDTVELYAAQKGLVICLRDRQSYEFVKKHFANEVHLVPDMAFYAALKPYASPESGIDRALLLVRNDAEAKEDGNLDVLRNRKCIEISDWPPMQIRDAVEDGLESLHQGFPGTAVAYDRYVQEAYIPRMLELGCRLVDSHSSVFTNRLHGGVLSLMRGKTVHYFDNSYGKIRGLYETWLSDCDQVRMATAESINLLKECPRGRMLAETEKSANTKLLQKSAELQEVKEERDRAWADRDAARKKHGEVAAERDRAWADRDAAWKKHDEVAAERDRAWADRDAAWKKHDEAVERLRQCHSLLDRTSRERDELLSLPLVRFSLFIRMTFKRMIGRG